MNYYEQIGLNIPLIPNMNTNLISTIFANDAFTKKQSINQITERIEMLKNKSSFERWFLYDNQIKMLEQLKQS